MEFDLDLDSMIEKATKMGKELKELDKVNKERKQRGLAELPSPQVLKDRDVRIRRPLSTSKTITADEALRRLSAGADDDDEVIPMPPPPKVEKKQSGKRQQAAPQASDAENPERGEVTVDTAVRQAEAARRVEDMKHGRINHIGNWKQVGVDMGLEGGSRTVLFDREQIREIMGKPSDPTSSAGDPPTVEGQSDIRTAPEAPVQMPKAPVDFAAASMEQLLATFFQDLYNKLGVSFDGLETTLSDLQGRVSEIVPRGAYERPDDYADEEYGQFKNAMSGKTKVTYDINGTKISFDAVKVYLEPPCLTIVTREDSAAVRPKPGSKLRISYEFDGVRYDNDLVTFLGTSFFVPELGMRFAGFVRDSDAEMLDAEAGA